MPNPRGFISVDRIENGYRPIADRLQDYREVESQLSDADRKLQASRCMDCGVPFCHTGCPVGNLMPEWQDKILAGDWQSAYQILQQTDNFPEFTGRLCPALCESACVLGINDDPVAIRENELSVIEHAFKSGYVVPKPPAHRTGRTVAVIGSGPAGMAAADSLNQAGHTVTLFEAADRLGGFLRYGVPDFKMEKHVIDRRVAVMEAEGVTFRTSVMVGRDLSVEDLRANFDAVCIAIGSRKARELPVEGRELAGIYQAADYLEQQNRIVAGDEIPPEQRISADRKCVIVIGGGDTGSDCIGTANRQGAGSVTQLEILPAYPKTRAAHEPWPLFPRLYKNSSSHEEGCVRMFSVNTRKFVGEDGHVKKLLGVQVEWQKGENGQMRMVEVPDTEFELEADLVVLAMGFEHPVHEGLVNALGVKVNQRGNIAVDANHMTNVPGIFATGDAKRGASLVVWAIQEGRLAAAGITRYLSQLADESTESAEVAAR